MLRRLAATAGKRRPPSAPSTTASSAQQQESRRRLATSRAAAAPAPAAARQSHGARALGLMLAQAAAGSEPLLGRCCGGRWRLPLSFGPVQRRGLASAPEVTTITMPALSPTMTHGTIAEWVKKPGDACVAGDVLCEIETDKATVAFEVQDEYVLAKVLEEAKGREVKVGEPVALSVEDEAAYQAFAALDKEGKIDLPTTAADAAAAAPPAPAPPSAAASPAPAPAPAPEPTNNSATEHLGPYILSPAARHLLESRSLELFRDVQGTGKGGRLTKGDVLHAIANGQVTTKVRASSAPTPAPAAPAAARAAAAAPAPAVPAAAPIPPPPAVTVSAAIPAIAAAPGSFTDTKNSSMRKVIARRLAESKASVPHSYETVECEIDAVLRLRKRLQKEYEAAFSVNDVIIRSAALALRDVPEANAAWDGAKGAAVLKPGVDVSVAVATPTGLITPIITGSDKRGLTAISAAMKDLAGRARLGKLRPEEFQGGSFTISNLGMFGVDEFSAVINPPQAAIMAVGRGSKRVRVPAYAPGQDRSALKPYSATVMTATLSFDRRVMDDAVAAQFLQAFKAYMSRPELLLL